MYNFKSFNFTLILQNYIIFGSLKGPQPSIGAYECVFAGTENYAQDFSLFSVYLYINTILEIARGQRLLALKKI